MQSTAYAAFERRRAIAKGAQHGDSRHRRCSEEAGERDHGRQSKPKAVAHLTVGERAARGKAARAVAPRSGHGEWEPAVRSA